MNHEEDSPQTDAAAFAILNERLAAVSNERDRAHEKLNEIEEACDPIVAEKEWGVHTEDGQLKVIAGLASRIERARPAHFESQFKQANEERNRLIEACHDAHANAEALLERAREALRAQTDALEALLKTCQRKELTVEAGRTVMAALDANKQARAALAALEGTP